MTAMVRESYAACTDSDVAGASSLVDGVFLSIDAAAKTGKSHTVAYRLGRSLLRLSATPVSLDDGGPLAVIAIKG